MPTYTYRCDNCGTQLDVQQKFSDSPLTLCPNCSTQGLQRVYKPVGIVFKGSGFYATDNRSPSGRLNGAASSKTESTESSSPTEKATETKTETKTESKTEKPKSVAENK